MLPLPLLLTLALAPPPGRAVPPSVTELAVTVSTAAGDVRALTLAGRPRERGQVAATIAAGTTPQVRWSVRNIDPKRAVDLAARFCIVPTRESGARERAVTDTVLGTALRPRRSTLGHCRTPIHEPGAYRVVLELLDKDGAPLQRCEMTLSVTGLEGRR